MTQLPQQRGERAAFTLRALAFEEGAKQEGCDS
jgi:hypothetical protein